MFLFFPHFLDTVTQQHEILKEILVQYAMKTCVQSQVVCHGLAPSLPCYDVLLAFKVLYQ